MAEKKVYIEYQFREGPYGGANQFLKCLRDYFIRQGVYVDSVEEADYILVNHTNISTHTLEEKRKHPEKMIIHRMDGPVSKHREHAKALDRHSFFLDRLICQGTIFQSEWTHKSCLQAGYKETGAVTVIHNAPDPRIFLGDNKKMKGRTGGKARLVATSWSSNWNKGFDVLKFLDENLDFSKYEFNFVGNTPITFQNIRSFPPQSSVQLAEILRNADIFIASSRNESCSNSLLEALCVGLPVVARDSGCYKEIIAGGGEIVESLEEFPAAIEKVWNNIEEYRKKIPLFDIEKVGEAYYCFMNQVGESVENGKAKIKTMNAVSLLFWKMYCFYIKGYQKAVRIYERGK